jgi:NADPH:quinone reductase-like Zn-dependent oxidoreductase/photosystem II stability/assembly factor-like uncharacterized protein/alpha-beta hydrolase superfamily lysophospholipase
MLTAAIATASALLAAVLSAGAQSTPEQPLPRRAGPLGLRLGSAATGPVVIDAVQPGSPAAKAGLEGGCTLQSLNGTPIASREELREAMRTVQSGETVQLAVKRGEDPVRTVAITAEAASESVPGSTVAYGSVRVPAGYRLRTIVTTPEGSPLAKDGKLPAFLYVSGIICDTVDRPSAPDAPDTRIVHAMADAGFVTMRVDKPGVGDSEGPPCSEIDLQTELAGYAAALKQLAAMPGVDPQRVYVFGHSMGGVLAPYLATEVPVRGTIVYGTIVRTWFEYQLENVRRQAAMAPGVSEADVTDAVLAEAKSSATILVDKKTLGDAWARWPELRQPTQGVMLDENHMSTRSMAFFHQLQDLNLARAWQESSGAALAVYGEYDWVTSEADHRKIADIVNARTAGAGTVLVRPQADHAFTTHPNLAASRALMGGGAFDRGLPEEVLRWIASVEGRTFVEQPQAGAAPAAGLREWQRLATEPYPGKQDDIFLVNERVGWYGNGAGKVFRTTDGGDTWTKAWEKPGTFVRCLAFVDEKVGVLGNIGPGYFPGVTDPVPVYRTEDGGTTWTPVTAIEGAPVVGLCAFDVVQVPFINAGKLDRRPRIVGVGRVGGPAAYIWSDDLGKTWKQGKLPEEAKMAFDVKFLDERRGFVASASSSEVNESNALILAPEDGGDTWEEVYRSSRPWEITWKFSFPDANTGYCTIQSYDPDPAAAARFVAKTLDGGRSWYEVALTDDHAVREFGIAFLDADTGWVGAVPHGFVTTDGGATWHDADIGNAVNKIRLLRSDAGVTGFAIGTEVRRMRLSARPGGRAEAPTMKAVRIHDYGDASRLTFEDAPVPVPAAGEMLVRVRAAGVNPVDWKIRSGMFRGGIDFAMPATLGFDVAGEVEAVGDGVSRFRAGDRVFAFLALSRGGGYAQRAIVKESEAAAVPASLDLAGAGATPLAALTAWQSLFGIAKLEKGQTVLIHGGAGGVGHFAVQLARWKGARVIATASAENAAFVKGLGADEVIDYKAMRFEDAARDVDVVLDTVGGETTNRSAAVLRRGGILVSIAGDPDPALFAARGARVAGHLVEPNGEQLAEIATLIESGAVKPHVATRMPLKDAAKAHTLSETGHSRGKIVLEVE